MIMDRITKNMLDNKGASSFFGTYKVLLSSFDIWKDLFKTNRNDADRICSLMLRNNITVDVIITSSSLGMAAMPYKRLLGVPAIGLATSGFAQPHSRSLGNPENPSYVPEASSTVEEPMTFCQRFLNTFMYIWREPILTQLLIAPFIADTEEDKKDTVEAYSMFSLLFSNTHHVTHGASVLSTNVVEVGGLHCRPGQDLSGDLKDFIDQSSQGVIFVSFGSTVKPSQMSQEKRQVFVDAFRQLEQNVLWKWDQEVVQNLSSNVKLSKWLPQQDILAHPNVRVFVTHGGLLSTQEAIYHKTPLVGIPLGSDQKPNIMRSKRRGFAVMLDWDSLTVESLLSGIRTAQHDSDIHTNLKVSNKLFLDQKESPLERAVWWVEFIARNQGAEFLKPVSLRLSWWQFYLLDVISVTIFVAVSCIVIFYSICIKLTKRSNYLTKKCE